MLLTVTVVLVLSVWLSDGVGPQQFTGVVTSSATSGQDNVVVNVGAVTTRPYDGQVVYFDQLYKSVETITVTNGGDGYTSTPSVSIEALLQVQMVKWLAICLLLKMVLSLKSLSSVVEVNIHLLHLLLFLLQIQGQLLGS